MSRKMLLAGIVLIVSFASCSRSDRFSFHPHGRQVVGSSPSVSYIWNPEYYIYRNGKYRFVQGSYRPVLSRKNYFKRSLRGYTYRGDYAVAR